MGTDAYSHILVMKCLSLKAIIYAGQFFTQQVVEHYYWLHRKSYSMQYCSQQHKLETIWGRHRRGIPQC